MQEIMQSALDQNKNILILAAPRSGSHALASTLRCLHPDIQYLKEICCAQSSDEPWTEIAPMLDTRPIKLAHIVQARSKIFLAGMAQRIKEHCVIVELRRRLKVKQFASWMYFQHILNRYHFDHGGQDYVPPGTITVDIQHIERFLYEQLLDQIFDADHVVYYEDTDLSPSLIQKNHYAYPIERIIKNLDLVQQYLGDWQYHD
jgi:hypothetical protein